MGVQVLDGRIGASVGPEQVEHLGGVRGVRNDQERRVGVGAVVDPGDQEVVDDLGAGVEEEGVAHLSGEKLRDVRGRPTAEQVGRMPSRDREDAHVRDVEQPDVLADRLVFGEDAVVVQRHLPPRERHQVAAVGLVEVVQRGPRTAIAGVAVGSLM